MFTIERIIKQYSGVLSPVVKQVDPRDKKKAREQENSGTKRQFVAKRGTGNF